VLLNCPFTQVDKGQHIGSGHHFLQQQSMRAAICALRNYFLPRDVNDMDGHALSHLQGQQSQHQEVEISQFEFP
jgi:hypothetical protein